MKRKHLRSALLWLFFYFIPGFVTALQSAAVSGYTGTDFQIPAYAGKKIVLPEVKIRVGIPFELSPNGLVLQKNFRGAVKADWKDVLSVFAGNISYSGSAAFLWNPVFSLTSSPLGSFVFPAAGIGIAFPPLTGSAGDLSGGVTVYFPCADGFQGSVQAVWHKSHGVFSAVTVPFAVGSVKITGITVAGLYHLPAEIPGENDSWYQEDAVYGETSGAAAVQEFRVQFRQVKLQTAVGAVSNPSSGFCYWGRVSAGFTARILSVHGGLYAGNGQIMTSSFSWKRSRLQGYINPKLAFSLGGRGTSRKILSAGIIVAANGRETPGIFPVFLAEIKAVGAIRLSFPRFSVQLTGGSWGIPVVGTAPKAVYRAERKDGGSVNVRLVNVIPCLQVTVFCSGYFFPAVGSGTAKQTVTAGLAIDCTGRNQLWQRLFPRITVQSDLNFRQGQVRSAATEVNAAWSVTGKIVTVRGGISVVVKHR